MFSGKPFNIQIKSQNIYVNTFRCLSLSINNIVATSAQLFRPNFKLNTSIKYHICISIHRFQPSIHNLEYVAFDNYISNYYQQFHSCLFQFRHMFNLSRTFDNQRRELYMEILMKGNYFLAIYKYIICPQKYMIGTDQSWIELIQSALINVIIKKIKKLYVPYFREVHSSTLLKTIKLRYSHLI